MMTNVLWPRPPRQPAGFVNALLAKDDVGEETWWKSVSLIGTPVVESVSDEQVKMTYFWRDPYGDETHSRLSQVYIDINCVTDHHSPQPQSLQRLPGTDVWFWSSDIDVYWRGSYSLIPVEAHQRPPTFSPDADKRAEQQRAWWISLFPAAISDPLNHGMPVKNSRHALSAAHMPGAPDQSSWHALDAGLSPQPDDSRLQTFSWCSAILGNERRIWLYTTGQIDTPTVRPLVLLLDGQNWVQNMPIFSTLDSETDSNHLPAAVWLFVDVIDNPTREKELPCNPAFWQAVEEELLPLAQFHAEFSDQADRTIVAGQSYGGLAATYAGLHRPDRFGRVLSQSGSFWWPDMKLIRSFSTQPPQESGWLTAQLINGKLPTGRLHVFMEAGSREGDMAPLSRQMHDALVTAGHRTQFRIFNGGHDSLCWRGGLIDGLRWLLADFSPHYSEDKQDAAPGISD